MNKVLQKAQIGWLPLPTLNEVNIGTFLLSVFIFHKKRFKNELMNYAPLGTEGDFLEKGWMSNEPFNVCNIGSSISHDIL